MASNLNEHTEVLLAPFQFGKDEMNFAEHPIAMLTDRLPKGQRSIKFEDEVYCETKKKLIPRKRLIEGSEEYGLPTATDDTVVLALIQLTKQKNDFTKREVDFTRLELIQLLGWKNEGASYDRLKLSLLRIKGVNYYYDNAWWDARLKRWTTKAFAILDTVQINDSRATDGQGGLFPSRFEWNSIVFDSFKAGFVRDIDFQLCMRLEHPTALRMYRFLGKRFYLRPEWVFDLKEFAHLYMNLGRNYEGGTQISRKLKPAIAELENVGFLEPLTEEERFSKKGHAWTIRLVKKASPPAPTISVDSEPEAPEAAIKPQLSVDLITRGVGKTKAAGLCRAFSAESIALKIEVFDWLVGKGDKKIAKNPAGFLVSSIVEDYALPHGFESAADRQKREEAKKAKEGQEADARRSKQAIEQQERRLAEQVKAYRQSQTPEQFSQLEAAAITEASEETRRNLDDPAMKPFRKSLVSSVVNEHIARLIQAEAKAAEPV